MALKKEIEALISAKNEFSYLLYKEVAKTEPGNIIFSPFSIHAVMFMASVGAASKTFDEIIATLHLNETIHSLETYRTFLEDLTSENDNLKLATGMFVDTAFNVKDSFVENSTKYLKSSMEKLNFKNDPEQQRHYLNDWVSNKTNNKIKDLFPEDSIHQDTALVLANAVHFNCRWEDRFKHTFDNFFFVTPSNKVPVKMMRQDESLRHYHDSDLKYSALELPYEGHDFKMMIILPDAKDGLKDLENNLSNIKAHEISNKMVQRQVTVNLPRFKLEQSLELEDTLSNLGCSTMFTREANFSNIVEDGNLYVSKVGHKAYIDVNEDGTEAAAATVFKLRQMCCIHSNEEFIVDHPFMLFIMTRCNSIIFVGRMTKID